jgi:hypothetical protein
MSCCPARAFSREGRCMPSPVGSGAQCEGEDWVKISQLANIDIATLHLYERHMEQLPPPRGNSTKDFTWRNCDFNCLMDWMPQYLQVGGGAGGLVLARCALPACMHAAHWPPLPLAGWTARRRRRRVVLPALTDWLAGWLLCPPPAGGSCTRRWPPSWGSPWSSRRRA